ncbi:MAG: TonB-dependent receptor [Cyclobacteriaceae bacterium]|nr:MAG: TonB-dependent receptor [Cyclobacteriaceae bacterium]
MKFFPWFCLLFFPGHAQYSDTLKRTELEEVVVTGQFEPQSVRRSVYQVRTIPMEQFAQRGATRLQDVLNTQLNIRFSQDLALGGSNLSLQGLSGQNVKVLIDGMPMVGRQGTSNEININQINIQSIERIEIVEGPMSVIYGADALAGVINIITRKADEDELQVTARVHEESAGREYSLRAGLHMQQVGAAYAKGPFHIRGDFTHNNFKGWKGSATGREMQWHPKQQLMGSLITGIRKNELSVHYRADLTFEDIYNPGEFEGGEALDQNYYTTRLMQQLQGNIKAGEKWMFNPAFSHTAYERQTQSVIVNQSTGSRTLSLGEGHQDITRFNGFTFRPTGTWKKSTALSLQPGMEVNYEAGSGGRIKEGVQSIADFALFLSAEWKAGRALWIRPAVRTMYNTVYSSPPIVPSVNIKAEINEKSDVRFAYGRGFRAPSIRELYFDFFDASHAIEGNTELQPELSHSFNVSWNYRPVWAGRYRSTITATAFYNTINNMIDFGQKPGNNLVTTYLNIDHFKTTGFTINQNLYSMHWDFSIGGGVTGRYNQLRDDYAAVPEFVWSPEVNASAVYRSPNNKLNISLYYKFTGRTPYYRLEDNGNGGQEPRLQQTGSFHWADLTTGYSLGKHITLSGGIRNLFDVIWVNNTGSTGGAHSSSGPRPIGNGRSYFFNLTYSFNQKSNNQ